MEKAGCLRKKLKHPYLHLLYLLFYLLHTIYVLNLKDFMKHIEKEATNITNLEVGLYELLHL